MSDTAKRTKRRLPVLQSGPSDEAAEERPAWHWVVISAAITLFAWLALAAVANAAVGALVASKVAFAVNAGVLAASAAAAGALVGRFGRRAGKNHAAAGGAATAMFGGALAWSQAAPGAALHLWLATWVLLGAIAAGGAYLGFWLTRPRARP